MNSLDHKRWQPATLGLGGNIGDPVAAMAEALRRIDQHPDCRVTAVSRLYRTPPWGKTDQADFYNACAAVETLHEPQELLAACLEIERTMKRVRVERWGPRTIDIDILTFADRTIDAEHLKIPHPRMTERAFVLMPLADIVPEQSVKGQSVATWLDLTDRTGIAVANENRAWWRG
ncbi:2-amino-4-hydroxy-6-hydroxymethyldihydropteridine diphosphokinase [Peteryoungia aggregata LMG 23059]|uniref:2-amino-4-hydroxy-6-hydroxymethyldihydropteridine pyrophosphokinase n=1 Tax=Peteryoungia aggregata LMG 23059 TaxID=1368425 RepID=A0ABU0G7Y6_9HYPH|nr:2-amino-4-hydroxy-6-hydroxymethyldihydropteridine diphosphokinase [Peteryoungia aggregata]MDQ0421456.1 2-amino-4-hydroxy-6-hydroxymethyldihydropteridine diphosphokinase [Peteryoungia aggregata LMG 23059]